MDVQTALSRPDLPASHYVLRLSQRAWKDLGFRTPVQRLDASVTRAHPLIAKFWDVARHPETIDRGETIRQVRHPRVFRIKAGDWRAAVWFDHDSAVYWMLRALALAKYSREDQLYSEFAELEKRRQLLPSTEELLVAQGEQYLASAIWALGDAVASAYGSPGEWCRASLVRPSGDQVRLGRVHVDVDDEIVTQHLVISLPAFSRSDLLVPSSWREVLFGTLFAADEPIMPVAYGLPEGETLRSDEVALTQVRAEQAPPDWLRQGS